MTATPEDSTTRLRTGVTTGSCAALAAQAAATLLATGHAPEEASLVLPAGTEVRAAVVHAALDGPEAVCAVGKDAGDDPDVTDGVLVYARVSRSDVPGVHIDGGEGIGRVTKRGLDQPVGAAAINSTPRAMIAAAVAEVCKRHGEDSGMAVVIAIPGGEEIARKTFNARLGIEGGLSVLGTTGIVQPMSPRALIDTIAVELRVVRAEQGDRVVLTPGNYGAAFIREFPPLGDVPVVKVSNFIGDALDAAADAGFRQVMLVGHLGKFVKLAGGIFNTHSRYADCRLELLALHAALAGCDAAVLHTVLAAATVEAGWDAVAAAGLADAASRSLLAAIDAQVARRVGGRFDYGIIVFDARHGVIGMNPGARALVKEWHG